MDDTILITKSTSYTWQCDVLGDWKQTEIFGYDLIYIYIYVTFYYELRT